MKTLKNRGESAVVVLEEVSKPEVLKKAEQRGDVSGQICPSHCGKYYPPCPTKK